MQPSDDDFTPPTGSALTIYETPALQGDIVNRVEEIFARTPATKAERAQQAVDLGEAITELAQMNKKFSAYLGSVAARVIAVEIWQAHPGYEAGTFTSEEGFWKEHGWDDHEIKYLKQWAQFHMESVKVLKVYGGFTDEDIEDLATHATPAKLGAIISETRQAKRQLARGNKKGDQKEQIQQKLRQIVTNAMALTDGDFKAEQANLHGEPERVAIMLNFIPIFVEGEEITFKITGTATREQVQAFDEKRGYFRSYYNGDPTSYADLLLQMTQIEHANPVQSSSFAGWDDDDMELE